MRLSKQIYVTQPLLPKLEDVYAKLQEIWKSKWLTNMGSMHNLFQDELREVLKVRNVSLFNNGTTALLIALKALDLPEGSEVITTPFTFAATPHSIAWSNLTPVFCDIEPNTMCIDPYKIENLITEKTSAILAVHVYGFPCNIKKIEEMAKKYNLKVIYDAAHAFSTEVNGKGIGSFGDVTMFSFHATKLFNTIEGGCLTYKDEHLTNKIYNLRNFGIQNEDIVQDIGINGKMNELQAAIGILNLQIFAEEKQKRAAVKDFYDKHLSKIQGVSLPKMPEGATNSYQYYPIVIEDDYSISRDELYDRFKNINIMTRKYFYPLCSDYYCYKDLKSASKDNLPVANEIKDKVLCLPFYGDLSNEVLMKICEVVNNG